MSHPSMLRGEGNYRHNMLAEANADSERSPFMLKRQVKAFD